VKKNRGKRFKYFSFKDQNHHSFNKSDARPFHQLAILPTNHYFEGAKLSKGMRVDTSWYRLAPAGTGWHRLAPAGTGWHRLAPAGIGWHRLAPAGTG
jgi:hypothetical protein